jgi:hypothetical protein
MSERNLARFGAAICLLLIVATWRMGDLFASVWFAWCCGFFFNEQLSPTDGTSRPTTKGQDPHPSREQKGFEQ